MTIVSTVVGRRACLLVYVRLGCSHITTYRDNNSGSSLTLSTRRGERDRYEEDFTNPPHHSNFFARGSILRVGDFFFVVVSCVLL